MPGAEGLGRKAQGFYSQYVFQGSRGLGLITEQRLNCTINLDKSLSSSF